VVRSRRERRRSQQQYFLTDPAVVRRLVAGIEPDDLVVDVGAGSGVLTLAAAAAGARVLAVERDPVWCERLRARVRAAGAGAQVRVVNGDLRDVVLPVGRWRVVANPPFGLSAALLRRLLDHPERGLLGVDLLLQWELARELATSPPASLLGSSWAPWWRFSPAERVPRSAFRPVPDVDAGLLRIRRRRPDVLDPALAPVWEAFLRERWPVSRRS